MSYNNRLAKRIEASFYFFPKKILNEIIQKKMFGGLVFYTKVK